MGIHELAPHSLTTSIATGLAFADWSAHVLMFSVSKDTGRAGGGVGGHEFAMLRETEKCLVPVVIATESRDNTLVQVVQEALCVVGLLGLRVAGWSRSAHGLHR